MELIKPAPPELPRDIEVCDQCGRDAKPRHIRHRIRAMREAMREMEKQNKEYLLLLTVAVRQHGSAAGELRLSWAAAQDIQSAWNDGRLEPAISQQVSQMNNDMILKLNYTQKGLLIKPAPFTGRN